MFFTQELLERRDSGFGLLWLAATLGAKSSFKKLPKRSVLTADISQLCDLIAEPNEPLALRLSSNLMIGVARVYKVKQEIFYTDVTTCFNSLKKAVQDIHSFAQIAAELQMGQPSVRPDALTLAVDPGTAFAMDFDNLFGDWDESQRVDRADSNAEESDDEFNPKAKKPRQKQKVREMPSLLENPRGNKHTLEEHHVHLLSGSFDESFNDIGFAGIVPSSSQFDGGFGFGDDVFGLPGGMDVTGEIGDELARELGEGWGGSQRDNEVSAQMNVDLFQFGMDDGNPDLDLQPGGEPPFGHDEFANGSLDEQFQAGSIRGNISPSHAVVVPLEPFSPVHDAERSASGAPQDTEPKSRAKRVRLLLDARTELTDEELKIARMNYMQDQDVIRRSMIQKKLDKESGKLIEEMIWGAPQGVQAPVLVDFWLENFKLQVEARSGTLYVQSHGEPPTKRRKVEDPAFAEEFPYDDGVALADERNPEGLGVGEGGDFPMGDYDFEHMHDGPNFEPESRLRSSETPGQARRVSRPPSVLGSQFDLDIGFAGSQRSALFPWDNAGVSSSVNGATFDFGREGSARPSFGRPEIRRGNSLGSRRESPLLQGRLADSPAAVGHGGEAFEFDVSGEDPALLESQQSDMNILTLERNSYNFLEYAKMQLKTFPTVTATLTFDDVVPKLTSTPHVAAAAFYHCLVLATKDLVGVAQDESYGALKVTVK
ncbi:Rec8 like protein-domain-containing protein [Amylocystis lapponica]|nr:Rec8 like protein-domain-containing protein [Amylocystis lapponica]